MLLKLQAALGLGVVDPATNFRNLIAIRSHIITTSVPEGFMASKGYISQHSQTIAHNIQSFIAAKFLLIPC
jgi:hypothetical protein